MFSHTPATAVFIDENINNEDCQRTNLRTKIPAGKIASAEESFTLYTNLMVTLSI